MERILNNWCITIAYFYAIFVNFIDEIINIQNTYQMITKTVFYTLNLVAIWLSPIKGAFIFAIILVITDTITGIMKAGKVGGIESIQSNKAFQIVPKIIFYALAIIICQALNNYVDGQIPWVKLVLVGIGWIEIKSIDENFKELFGHSFIDKILEGLKSFNKIEKRK